MVSGGKRFRKATIRSVGTAIHASIRQVHGQQNFHQTSLDISEKSYF
jgi:hypothetical protein